MSLRYILRLILPSAEENVRASRDPQWLFSSFKKLMEEMVNNSPILRWFKKNVISNTTKVFAFGQSKVRTSTHPLRHLTWWNHVAPIVEVKGAKYVLDPSIEAFEPITLRHLVAKMSTPSKVSVVSCESGAYSPSSSCDVASSIQTFLLRQWNQLKRVEKNPEDLLGSNPPWLEDA